MGCEGEGMREGNVKNTGVNPIPTKPKPNNPPPAQSNKMRDVLRDIYNIAKVECDLHTGMSNTQNQALHTILMHSWEYK
jgi:hypothetical protein